MHTVHRSRSRRARRHSGYTLLEVTVALVILLVSVTAITGAVATVQVSSAKARLEQVVLNEAQVDATLIASQPYSALAGGTFVVPDSCAVVGSTDSASCVDLGGRRYPVRWVVTPAVSPSHNATVVGTVSVGTTVLSVTALADNA